MLGDRRGVLGGCRRGVLGGGGGGVSGLGTFQPALQPFQPGQQRLLPGTRRGQQDLRAHQLEQQPRRRGAAHLDQPLADDFRRAGQFGLAEPAGLLGHPVQPVGGQVEQAGLARAGHGGQHDQVAEPVQQVGGEPPGVVATFHHPVHRAEHRGAVRTGERVRDLVQQVVVGVPEQRHRPVVAQPVFPRAGQQLVQDGQRIPHRTGAGPDHQRQHRRLVADLLRGQDLLQQLTQDRGRHQAERVVMGARPDRRDDLFRLGGGEDELEVWRRLLDQLEEGVEALPRHHVRLVDDVDLEPAGDRRVERPLAQVPGVVHAAVRGGVDLDHIQAARPVRGERDTRLALAARVRGGPLGAVQ